jgi:pimeloyl-ACP methyl ester carboxylesterase
MPYARRDELELYYERAGSGEPELLFVPGWCSDTTFFAPQFEHFAATHAVTVFDPRGCGRSSVPADGYDIPTLADDVAWLCAELEISKPVVVGHSLGAMVAIELAARHPSVPLAVVADDPGPINPLPETARIYEGFADEMAGPSGEAVRRAWVEGIPGATADDELRATIVETMCAVPLGIAAAVIRDLRMWNGAAALALCEVPLLLLLSYVGGSNDPSRLRQFKPDVHVAATVGAGHFHQLEAPGQVNAMIERYLEVTVPAA